MSILLAGFCISKGVAHGKAYVMEQGQTEIPEYGIDESQVDSEVARYADAVKSTRDNLQNISAGLSENISDDVADFISSHILTLEESVINRGPKSLIRKSLINAEWALKQQTDELVQVLDEIEDPYLQSSKDDVMQVSNMILKTLSQHEITPLEKTVDSDARIIVTRFLSPSDLATIHPKHVSAFVVEHGAPNSHAAIIARNLNVPVIAGIQNAHQYIKDGDEVLVDGKYGSICINPDRRSVKYYINLEKNIRIYKSDLLKIANKPALTLDHKKICLYANLDQFYDLSKLNRIAPEGIGLYRTESLYLDSKEIPDEQFQTDLYSELAQQDIPVTIRTLDIEDRQLFSNSQQGHNHMLGLRAIRFSLARPDIFMTQLRAILRASTHGKVRIILPMVIALEEITSTKSYIEKAMVELDEAQVAYDKNIEIGVMIETPAMALSVDLFARHVDFFAIGTNDLVQYILAIDRTDEQVNHLYDPCHPAVLNTIYRIIQTTAQTETPVYICGEMASEPKYTRLLLGMGLRTFSVMPAQLLELKQTIRETNISDAELYVNEILKSSKPKRIKELIEKLNHA